jgi:hypothetical protein
MKHTDIDSAIKNHIRWRRQFLNAFAGGDYADMPLSEHRSCVLAKTLNEVQGDLANSAEFQLLINLHKRFHFLANEVVELSSNGMASSADLLLPDLSETTHQLNTQLDKLREIIPAA